MMIYSQPEYIAMLIADKVENRKDFERYHWDHSNAARLTEYFREWLTALGISEDRYMELARAGEIRGGSPTLV